MIVRTFRKEWDKLIDNGTHDWTREEMDYNPAVWACVAPSDLPADFSVETYTIEHGVLIRASPEVIAEREAAKRAISATAEIAELRAYLTSTDYTAIKCGELGLSMVEAYPDIHAQRTAARARINELEKTAKQSLQWS